MQKSWQCFHLILDFGVFDDEGKEIKDGKLMLKNPYIPRIRVSPEHLKVMFFRSI